jgi:formylglycine-generating enzyme required for sulfatase activity
VITVRRWSGLEARALREAKRMGVRAFADYLGISPRMVSKWESGGEQITPRPVNQEALDTVLAASTPDVQARFAEATMGLASIMIDLSSDLSATAEAHQQVRHPLDGKLMTLVSAGVFLSGAEKGPVWLSAYYIDVFPTTNADYSRFVAATGHRPPSHWDDGKYAPGRSDHPVVFVTWRDANAYAGWAQKALPSSQQWEKAARGTKGDVYPWGDQPTPAKCNVREGRIASTTPVDRFHSGVSPFDVYDMCGNTWEWCSTETDPDRFELKGSAWTSPLFRAIPSLFNDASADMSDDDTSFRCAIQAEILMAQLATTS